MNIEQSLNMVIYLDIIMLLANQFMTYSGFLLRNAKYDLCLDYSTADRNALLAVENETKLFKIYSFRAEFVYISAMKEINERDISCFYQSGKLRKNVYQLLHL